MFTHLRTVDIYRTVHVYTVKGQQDALSGCFFGEDQCLPIPARAARKIAAFGLCRCREVLGNRPVMGQVYSLPGTVIICGIFRLCITKVKGPVFVDPGLPSLRYEKRSSGGCRYRYTETGKTQHKAQQDRNDFFTALHHVSIIHDKADVCALLRPQSCHRIALGSLAGRNDTADQCQYNTQGDQDHSCLYRQIGIDRVIV